MRDVTALVPMKGNSERVPRKNIRPLAGKPAFAWIMDALQDSRYIGQIVVNTDSMEIREALGRDYPEILILERPEHLLGDRVPIQPLIEHDLGNTSGELYLQTHATNPLVTTKTIDAAIEAFIGQDEHDSLFTVTPLHTRLYWPDGSAINHDPDILLPTQDLPPVMEENSCLYIFTRSVFERRRHRLGEHPMMLEMSADEAVDIDEPFDFVLADMMLRHRLEASQVQ